MLKISPLLLIMLIIACTLRENDLAAESPVKTTSVKTLASHHTAHILDTIYVGPDEKIKDLATLFSNGKIDNTHIIVKGGVQTQNGELWISGHDLIIEAIPRAAIHCTSLHSNVIWLSGERITLKNFLLKHHFPGSIIHQNCTGRVIALDNAKDIVIENCDINGCGLVGVHDNLGNSNVLIRNNYIHYNALAPFGNINGDLWMKEVPDHPVILFEGNRIENNGPNRMAEDTLELYQLPSEMREHLSGLLKDWEDNYWGTCGRIMDIDMNCDNCPSSQIEVLLKISNTGEVIEAQTITNRIDCQNQDVKQKLEDCFLESMKDWYFTESFSHQYLKITLGSILKC